MSSRDQVKPSHILIKHQGSRRKASWKDPEVVQITAEDESGIHVWDLRKAKVPLQVIPGHANWTWAVKCNPEYDGLILSAGTDSAVNLWYASASSSDDKPSQSPVESIRQRLSF
ncbi:PREDICTED: WD repeat-containing protein DWA2-like isoform X2 [Camelina sativa]|uniref:WD repeat-containing protein DWA2-like isoform X2 n=1 Tax=Camelina sativa TaxID=90675 RepID=A0ABM0VFM8_CAMSA|nr:PREDICTED: WD repeat-containing protein DWA2-like isoform X2 [Camelina sativa]